MAKGKRPAPFRTRKLSLSAPMVLHGRLCGRVGRRRTYFDEGHAHCAWPSSLFHSRSRKGLQAHGEARRQKRPAPRGGWRPQTATRGRGARCGRRSRLGAVPPARGSRGRQSRSQAGAGCTCRPAPTSRENFGTGPGTGRPWPGPGLPTGTPVRRPATLGSAGALGRRRRGRPACGAPPADGGPGGQASRSAEVSTERAWTVDQPRPCCAAGCPRRSPTGSAPGCNSSAGARRRAAGPLHCPTFFAGGASAGAARVDRIGSPRAHRETDVRPAPRGAPPGGSGRAAGRDRGTDAGCGRPS